MPTPLKREYDPDVYYDDWLEEQNRLRHASAQPRQSDYQPRRGSQSRPDARRPKSGASRSQSYTASYEQRVSDAEYSALQPQLDKYKSANVYMQRAAACMRRRDKLESKARRGCEEGTMTAAKAAIIKKQVAYEEVKYGKAMTAFKEEVRHINATSDILYGRVTALRDDTGSITSTQSSTVSNQARSTSTMNRARRASYVPSIRPDCKLVTLTSLRTKNDDTNEHGILTHPMKTKVALSKANTAERAIKLYAPLCSSLDYLHEDIKHPTQSSMAQDRRASSGSIYSVLDKYPLKAQSVDQVALQEASKRALFAQACISQAAEDAKVIDLCDIVLSIGPGDEREQLEADKRALEERRPKLLDDSGIHTYNSISYRIKAETGTGQRIIDLGDKHAVYKDGTRPGQKPADSSLNTNASNALKVGSRINARSSRKTPQAVSSSTASASGRQVSMQNLQSAGQASRRSPRTDSFAAAGSASSETPYPPMGTIKHSGMSDEKKREHPHLRKLFSPFRRARGGERQAA